MQNQSSSKSVGAADAPTAPTLTRTLYIPKNAALKWTFFTNQIFVAVQIDVQIWILLYKEKLTFSLIALAFEFTLKIYHSDLSGKIPNPDFATPYFQNLDLILNFNTSK